MSESRRNTQHGKGWEEQEAEQKGLRDQIQSIFWSEN